MSNASGPGACRWEDLSYVSSPGACRWNNFEQHLKKYENNLKTSEKKTVINLKNIWKKNWKIECAFFMCVVMCVLMCKNHVHKLCASNWLWIELIMNRIDCEPSVWIGSEMLKPDSLGNFLELYETITKKQTILLF